MAWSNPPGQGTFVVEKFTPFVITLTGDPRTGFGGAEDDVYQGIQKLDTWDSADPPVEIQMADSQISAELQLAEEPAWSVATNRGS